MKIKKKELLVLILIVLFASIMILLIVIRNNMTNQKINGWDKTEFYKGGKPETIELDKEQISALIDLIYNYEFVKVDESNSTSESNKIYFGGRFFRIIFSKKNVVHEWKFSGNGITQTIYENNLQEVIRFNTDKLMLGKLDEFTN